MKDLTISFNHLPVLSQEKKPKIDYEFQALGLEMQEFFLEKEWPRIWMLFCNKGVTEQKVRHAFKECVRRDKKSVSYLVAIIKNLK